MFKSFIRSSPSLSSEYVLFVYSHITIVEELVSLRWPYLIKWEEPVNIEIWTLGVGPVENILPLVPKGDVKVQVRKER